MTDTARAQIDELNRKIAMRQRGHRSIADLEAKRREIVLRELRQARNQDRLRTLLNVVEAAGHLFILAAFVGMLALWAAIGSGA